jgi:hypothetical protein
MAPKKVTNVGKPKKKIIMTMVELKKELITKWEKVFMEYVSLPSSNISPLHFLFLFWLVNVCMILCIQY